MPGPRSPRLKPRVAAEISAGLERSNKATNRLSNAVVCTQNDLIEHETVYRDVAKHLGYATSFRKPLTTAERDAIRNEEFLKSNGSRSLGDTFQRIFVPRFEKEYGFEGTKPRKVFVSTRAPPVEPAEVKIKKIIRNDGTLSEYMDGARRARYSKCSQYEIDYDLLSEIERGVVPLGDHSDGIAEMFLQSSAPPSDDEYCRLDVMQLDEIPHAGSQAGQGRFALEYARRRELLGDEGLHATASELLRFVLLETFLVKVKNASKTVEENAATENMILRRRQEILDEIKHIEGLPIDGNSQGRRQWEKK